MEHPISGQSHLVRSYLTLRKSVGIIGIALPFVLALGGLLLINLDVQTSISRYYHTGMRDVFVGSLCAIGVFLWSYRGYERKDNVAGNVAAIAALGVAFFPTFPEPDPTLLEQVAGWLHLGFAAVFFGALAYFSLFLFRLSDKKNPTPRKLMRNTVFTICGYAIIGCILAIVVVSIPVISDAVSAYKPVFWLEAIAVVAFGMSWLVKGEAILKDLAPEDVSPRVAPRIPSGSEVTADEIVPSVQERTLG